jgi:hypothetical protein
MDTPSLLRNAIGWEKAASVRGAPLAAVKSRCRQTP